jgi:hypothetical protein
MHSAYPSESCCNCVWLGAEPELTAPLVAFVLLTAPLDVVVPMLATNGALEPPPHPATSGASAARPTANTTREILTT